MQWGMSELFWVLIYFDELYHYHLVCCDKSSSFTGVVGHKAEISSAQFNWDCSLVATGSMDKTCKLWDVGSGQALFLLLSLLLLWLLWLLSWWWWCGIVVAVVIILLLLLFLFCLLLPLLQVVLLFPLLLFLLPPPPPSPSYLKREEAAFNFVSIFMLKLRLSVNRIYRTNVWFLRAHGLLFNCMLM